MGFKNIVTVRESETGRSRHFDAWLSVDSIPVSYISLTASRNFAGYLCIKAVETRRGYRGQGHATELMETISERLGMPLGSLGVYTPEGYTALLGKAVFLPGVEIPSGPAIASTTFVTDWDGRYGPVQA